MSYRIWYTVFFYLPHLSILSKQILNFCIVDFSNLFAVFVLDLLYMRVQTLTHTTHASLSVRVINVKM